MDDGFLIETWLHSNGRDAALVCIGKKVLDGKRITAEEGHALYHCNDLGYLAALANHVRQRKHGNCTYFNRNLHIEPTNLCVFDCKFCAYSRMLRQHTDEQAWEFSREDILDQVRKAGEDITELHIVGGVHPKMGIAYFTSLISDILMIRPDIQIKAFTAVELEYMCRKAGLSYTQGLMQLKEAGQVSLPGGGAEIFDTEIRKQICDDKCSAEQWLQIHEAAHSIGMPSNATMLYGHIENYAHRISHMEQLRKLQDRTGGFQCFIPLKFRNKNNQMSCVSEVSVTEDLKNYAVSRIFLDNIEHLKAYWPMCGRDVAQMALAYGVDDLDGTIADSTKIYSMAGAEETSPGMQVEEIIQLITAAGRTAVERNTLYEISNSVTR